MGDRGTVRTLNAVRPSDGGTTQQVLGNPLVHETAHSTPNSNTTGTRSSNTSQKRIPGKTTREHHSVNGQRLSDNPGVHRHPTDTGLQSSAQERVQSKLKGSPSQEAGHTNSGPKAKPQVQLVPNSVAKSDRPKQGTFTSSERQGTFVKDNKDNDSLSSGFEIPRITSASMPQRQVIRTDGDNRERELIVSIVDRGESPDHVVSVTKAEAELGKIKETSLPEASTRSTNSISKDRVVKKGPVKEKLTASNKPGNNVNVQNKHGGKRDMDEESKENLKLNTDGLSAKQTVEKSLDKTTPFRLSNSGNTNTKGSNQEGAVTGSTKETKSLPPKTPVPAEPVIHKKSDFVSQHKKKPGPGSPEDMTTYDSSSMVRQAALASQKTKDEEKPLADDRIERLTAMLNQMSEKLAESEERNKVLKQKNEELEDQARRHKDMQSKSSAELQLLKNEWNELTKDLENSRKEREKMEEELKSKGNEDKDHLQTLTEQNSKLDNELTQAKGDMKELILTREKENKANEDIMKNLKAELADAKNNIGHVGTDYENQIKELKEIIQKLKAENELLSKRIKDLEAASSDVKGTLNTTVDENEKLKEQMRKMNVENQELLEKLNKSKLEVSRLADFRKESDDLGEEVENLLKEKQSLSEALQEKDRIIAKQQNDIKSIDGLAQTLQSEQDQNAQLAQQVNRLTEESLLLRKEVTDSSKEVSDLRKRLSLASEKVETGKVALSSMTELIKEKQAHIEDLQKEVKTLTETNSNYLVALEAFSSTKKRDEDIAKSKFDDIDTSHRKLLDENKRLRTVLAHKNMSETSRNADSEDLIKALDQKDQELDRARERIAHLETMLDDVYKTREIQRMQADLGHEEESKMSISSLPDIRQDSRATAYNSYNPMRQKGRTTKSQESQWANHVDRDHEASRNLRNYRDAQGYAQRFEHRPNRKRPGVSNRLK